jgi:radical SAM/Cys-rich protein
VDAQRGPHAYERSIVAIGRLNAAGYGIDDGLQLNLVYNPAGPFLPPPQVELEQDYRRELRDRFGIEFSRLLTITNMPLGRFGAELKAARRSGEYLRLLEDSFNPETVPNLMCRHQISVGWDGTLYDCDFNLALNLPVNHSAPDHISRFDPAALRCRRIVTGEHCLGCTAGNGSSCGGSLT